MYIGCTRVQPYNLTVLQHPPYCNECIPYVSDISWLYGKLRAATPSVSPIP